jgi:hypothetical protein
MKITRSELRRIIKESLKVPLFDPVRKKELETLRTKHRRKALSSEEYDQIKDLEINDPDLAANLAGSLGSEYDVNVSTEDEKRFLKGQESHAHLVCFNQFKETIFNPNVERYLVNLPLQGVEFEDRKPFYEYPEVVNDIEFSIKKTGPHSNFRTFGTGRLEKGGIEFHEYVINVYSSRRGIIYMIQNIAKADPVLKQYKRLFWDMDLVVTPEDIKAGIHPKSTLGKYYQVFSCPKQFDDYINIKK